MVISSRCKPWHEPTIHQLFSLATSGWGRSTGMKKPRLSVVRVPHQVRVCGVFPLVDATEARVFAGIVEHFEAGLEAQEAGGILAVGCEGAQRVEVACVPRQRLDDLALVVPADVSVELGCEVLLQGIDARHRGVGAILWLRRREMLRVARELPRGELELAAEIARDGHHEQVERHGAFIASYRGTRQGGAPGPASQGQQGAIASRGGRSPG
jgi:hypothetical protein